MSTRSASRNASRAAAPTTIRVAGAITAAEGLILLVGAVVYAIRGMEGVDQSMASSYGTALWFGLIGGGVAAGGIALLRGRRWGRAIAFMANVLLLPVAYALLGDSNRPLLGMVVGAVAVVGLVFLLHPASSRWLAADYAPDAEPDTESDTESEPDAESGKSS